MVGSRSPHQAQVPRLREVSSTAVCPCCALFSGGRYIAISSPGIGFADRDEPPPALLPHPCGPLGARPTEEKPGVPVALPVDGERRRWPADVAVIGTRALLGVDLAPMTVVPPRPLLTASSRQVPRSTLAVCGRFGERHHEEE